MYFRDLFLFVLVVFTCSNVSAGSICISSIGGCDIEPVAPVTVIAPTINLPPLTGGDLVLSKNGTISVDGDLFLDYSVFSNNEDLSISAGTTINGETVTIYSYIDEPLFPDSYSTYQMGDSEVLFTQSGSWVLFSTIPFVGGTFEATGNLYIGNYSSISPIPLPPSIYLFLTSLFLPLWFNIRKVFSR